MELLGIVNKSDDEAMSVMCKFKDSNQTTRNFNVKLEEKKQIWSDLFSVIREKKSSIQLEGLNCARILSRDKPGLNEAVTENIVSDLMNLGNIDIDHGYNDNYKVCVESLKVLSNLLQQSSVVQSYCTKNGFLSKLIQKISSYASTDNDDHESKMFDFRLLFLFTALLPEQREIAKHNHDGVEKLLKVVRDACQAPEIDDNTNLVMCEALKVIFNLTVNNKEEDNAEMIKIATVIRNLVRMKIQDFDIRMKVISNTINVVTNMENKPDPVSALLKSTDVPNTAEEDKHSHGVVVNVLDKFMDFLSHKLNNSDAGTSLKEDITPCLSVLWNISRTSRPARKYLKSIILPPLTAEVVKSKPEAANTLKGRLVSLMTNSVTGDISTMVAELLYALCKENVGRLVKHTGYGNAAGLLARRGLMAGGRGQPGNFSSDEESDTEEYKEVRDMVNPISGCIDVPRVNPLEGMSEEQKEYEAMQLVNLMDKMQRSGLISPARVGEDGRPEAVDHVLQLIEDGEANNEDHENSD